ncbi:MAG TPA: putative peptidoglycan glycosyltransferase FtsW, partial [Candidatus Deferrimicrobium sp.]|nr:putative peptidoglycan glycosyltransferase FtsW [Candidatus Deferrimicrobium sp.]
MLPRKTGRFQEKRKIDERLLLAYLIALVSGLAMIYSSSSVLAEARFGSHLYFFRNQLLWAFLSLVAIIVVCKLDLCKTAVFSPLALMLVLAALAAVFLMTPRNGAHRWLYLGPMTVQPSELFKFVAVFYLAFSLSNRERDVTDMRQVLRRYGPLLGVGLILIMLEPNLGTTIVATVTALGMFFLAGARLKHLFGGLGVLAASAVIVVFGLGYKKARVLDYIASVIDPLQGSYQTKQAALTLGAGGLFGFGLGDGRQKLFFLPYPHTDFIFATMGEEIGFIGLLAVMACLFFILWRGLRIAAAQPDRFGYLLAAGMTLSLFVNCAVNIGVVTCLLPVTGLPLPFFSYGGSSLLISSAAVGVLLNLSRRVV